MGREGSFEVWIALCGCLGLVGVFGLQSVFELNMVSMIPTLLFIEVQRLLHRNKLCEQC